MESSHHSVESTGSIAAAAAPSIGTGKPSALDLDQDADEHDDNDDDDDRFRDLLSISANGYRHRRMSEGSVVVTPRSDTSRNSNSGGGGRRSGSIRKVGSGSGSSSNNSSGLDSDVLAGLTVAGLAATVLHTVHTYQVEQFNSSKSSNSDSSITSTTRSNPYESMSGMILKTASYLVGAWLVDSYAASRRSRTDWIGLAGLVLAATFVLVHLVGSATPTLLHGRHHYWMFECMRSVYILVLAAPVIANHRMSPSARIYFMASGQCVNLGTALVVRWLCELISLMSMPSYEGATTTQPLSATSIPGLVKLLISVAVCVLFTLAQAQISGSPRPSLQLVLAPLSKRVKEHDDDDWNEDDNDEKEEGSEAIRSRLFASTNTSTRRAGLHWQHVAQDLSRSPRFLAWLGMEVCMEVHIAIFHVYFLYSVAQTIGGSDHEKEGVANNHDNRAAATAAWTVVVTRKFAAIVTYLPMLMRHGYYGVYKALFYMVGGLLALILMTRGFWSASTINNGVFVLLIATVAVHSAGFQLAMADLSLDLHYRHVLEGRVDEPYLASVLIGVNALICKPIAHQAAALVTAARASPQDSIYILTVLPLIGSILQLWFWRRYDLSPRRTATIRDELFRDSLTGSDLPR